MERRAWEICTDRTIDNNFLSPNMRYRMISLRLEVFRSILSIFLKIFIIYLNLNFSILNNFKFDHNQRYGKLTYVNDKLMYVNVCMYCTLGWIEIFLSA